MGYRIRYGKRKRIRWSWAGLMVPAVWLGLMTAGEGWYEALARYVGAAIRAHGG